MITEQGARNAARRCVNYEHATPEQYYVDERVLYDWAIQELARREAERAERAKPIDAEWCRKHGGQGSDDQMSWQVSGGEWVRVTLYQPHGSSTTFMGRKLYDIQTVGDLSDLLAALKGGA